MVSITAVVIMLRNGQTRKKEFDSNFICGIFVHATSLFENREKINKARALFIIFKKTYGSLSKLC